MAGPMGACRAEGSKLRTQRSLEQEQSSHSNKNCGASRQAATQEPTVRTQQWLRHNRNASQEAATMFAELTKGEEQTSRVAKGKVKRSLKKESD